MDAAESQAKRQRRAKKGWATRRKNAAKAAKPAGRRKKKVSGLRLSTGEKLVVLAMRRADLEPAVRMEIIRTIIEGL